MEEANYIKTPLMGSKSAEAAALADLPSVVEAFNKCRKSDGTLATDHYLAAINELVRLFRHLGKGLGLALQGIDKSITALEILRVSGTGCYYKTFDLLLQHEKHLNIHKNKDKSGTSHAVRLYQYTSFMLEFLTKTEEALERDESYRGVARVATYQNTLGRCSYHPQWLQAAIKVMLFKSPNRHEIIKTLGQGARGVSSPREVLRDILSKAYPVHETLAKLIKCTLE